MSLKELLRSSAGLRMVCWSLPGGAPDAAEELEPTEADDEDAVVDVDDADDDDGLWRPKNWFKTVEMVLPREPAVSGAVAVDGPTLPAAAVADDDDVDVEDDAAAAAAAAPRMGPKRSFAEAAWPDEPRPSSSSGSWRAFLQTGHVAWSCSQGTMQLS